MISSAIFKNVYRSLRPTSSLAGLRTHNCGELRLKNKGEEVCIMGWLAYKRMDRFLILRDRHGYVQVKFDPMSKIAEIAKNLTYESVLKVKGCVKSRGSNVNKKMATGEIEIDIAELSVLNLCDANLPFDPNGNASEKIRLKHRYLDIRGERLHNNLRLRSKTERAMSRFLEDEYNFEKVETPTLFRRTPGGAAEFLVPCGAPNIGTCYSLPQSPQQHKQLMMVGGWDRYYQIARCYRDEGSKGDRQPEFTQVDMEMSFTSQEEILHVLEGMIIAGWPEHLSDIKPTAPFPRLKYNDAIRLYGIDKPDMRIPWTIQDATSLLEEGIKAKNAGNDWCARLIVCKGQASFISSSLKKEWKRLIQMNANNAPFDVHTSQKKQWFKNIQNSELCQKYDVEKDDAVVFCWGEQERVQWTLGQLRNLVAEAGNLRKQRSIACHWIVDFPLFSRENGHLVSTHHPFTAPIDEHKCLLDYPEQRLHITGQHYDLVINGVEMGGGSIRIHNHEEQRKVLLLLNEDSSEMNHLISALAYGAPPHGGFALGLDRFVALLAGDGDPSVPVRDVIAFPKTKEGRDLMCGAPVPPSEELLARIRTLGDVGGNDSHDSGEDSDGGDRRQEFYVGGSEQSGQQVLGPETGRRDFRESVFNAAREAGAEEYRVEDDEAESSQFGGGMGIRLGRTNNDHVLPTPVPQRAQPVIIHLYFWENGFSLNDGPLRNPSNSADRDFIADVMRGRIPQELVAAHPGVEIDVRLERKDEPYVPPKSKPFEGTGARLGGVVPNVVSNSAPAVPSSSQQPNELEDNLAKAQSDVQLDPNTPKTKLQIRLQDGTRLVGEFNSTHTIASVRNFAVTARPQLAFQEFQLMTTYPPKVIDDETSSLSDAGLLSAVIAIKPVS